MIDAKWLKERTSDVRKADEIDRGLYRRFNVKCGLRNENGTGVLVGLTSIGNVHGYLMNEGEKLPVDGRLSYRGIDVRDLVKANAKEHRTGFEEAAYLLLFGNLPTAKQLAEWMKLIANSRKFPAHFLENAIFREPGENIMNAIARAVLAEYAYDKDPDRLDMETTLRQSVSLIAQFPAIAAYAYQAKAYTRYGKPLVIRDPSPEHGTAWNFLSMIRDDGKVTKLEEETLDLSLILHAEHGGGNNSTFVTHVVTSSLTDTYSSVAASVLSLKGSRHGGANLRTMRQMDELKESVKDWSNEGQVLGHLEKIVSKKAGDGTGLIYGMGHAVYTLSDPRAVMLKAKAAKLAEACGKAEEFKLYEAVERLAPKAVKKFHPNAREAEVCANVDLYSGFVYDLLGIPRDLYTPLFATARVVGWCAHRMEELNNAGPIIRPAYKPVYAQVKDYVPIEKR